MLAQDFLKAPDGAPEAPIYLVCSHKGERAKRATFEPLLASRAVERLIRRYVDPSMKDFAYAGYHAEETDVGEVIETCQTLPFLAERRVTAVHGAEAYDKGSAAKALAAYLASPNPACVLILVSGVIDRRSKIFKLCQENGVLLECPVLRERELNLWVHDELKARDKRINPAAVSELLERAGARLADVQNAIELVSGFAGASEPEITLEHVRMACADVAEDEVWALTDAIAESDMGRAVKALRMLLELGKAEIEIMGTINWLLKTAYAVAKDGPGAVAPFQAKKVRPLVDKLGLRKIRDAFRLCMEAEVMLRSTGVNRALALELLVVKLAAPRQQPGRPAASGS